MVQVSASVGDGRTLQQFSNLIANRIKYLNESTKDAVAACAIDALKSIRAATRKATKGSVVKDVTVTLSPLLYPSFKTVGQTKTFCLRYKGSKQEYTGKGRIIQGKMSGKLKNCNVYVYELDNNGNKTEYLIVASNLALATKSAKEIKRKAALRYAGLAKTALTLLMRKTATVSDVPDVEAYITNKANQLTTKTETANNGLINSSYGLSLSDKLNYATLAVNGGDSGVTLALQKSMNKITATINKKCEKLLFFEKLDTPFPEIRKR